MKSWGKHNSRIYLFPALKEEKKLYVYIMCFLDQFQSLTKT